MPKDVGERNGRGSVIWFHAPELCKIIRKEYESGESINQIRNWLNTSGMETPRGGKWNFQAVAGAIEQAGGKLRTRSEAAVARIAVFGTPQRVRSTKRSDGNVVPGE